MMMRTTSNTVTFQPFYLKGVDRLLPPVNYPVVTDEELIEGLSFSAYHRISTVMFVPAESGSAVEMVTIDPLDLQAAIDRDARERIDDSGPPQTRD
jgi:hypothetical protein